MPVLLEVLSDAGFVPDLFVEKSVAREHAGIVRQAAKNGSYIGCHGEHIDPLFANELSDKDLVVRYDSGRKAVEALVGKAPLAYREANFAVDSRTLSILMKSGFLVDSSVLPNRFVKKHGLRSFVDHRGAPPNPFRPGNSLHTVPGVGALLEIPVTDNPLNRGAPIGTGFLNWKGVDFALRALRDANGDPVTFLIHPWECVNLALASTGLPEWVLAACKENSRDLANLLEIASAYFVPATLPEVCEEFGVQIA